MGNSSICVSNKTSTFFSEYTMITREYIYEQRMVLMWFWLMRLYIALTLKNEVSPT